MGDSLSFLLMEVWTVEPTLILGPLPGEASSSPPSARGPSAGRWVEWKTHAGPSVGPRVGALSARRCRCDGLCLLGPTCTECQSGQQGLLLKPKAGPGRAGMPCPRVRLLGRLGLLDLVCVTMD